MDFPTILASLRRNSLGPLLIVLQVAITLAILLNVAGLVQQHVARIRSVSGVDEANVFTLLNRWVGQPADARALLMRDLAVLRGTPGVVSAVSSNGIPLGQRGWGTTIDTEPVDPARQGSVTRAQLYYLDDHGLEAWGLKMHRGRWFTAEDVVTGVPDEAGQVILTRALARHLFPDGDALGKVIYMNTRPDTVIGIVENLQGSSPGNPALPIESGQYSAILPGLVAIPGMTADYIVRTRPGTLQGVMQEAERRLREANPLRVITQFQAFAETRHDAYRGNRALTAILVAVNLLLVCVTALGIAGLASYWVAQRQRMIGVRRALGARRGDILAYFHAENLLIVGTGVLLGVGLGLFLNSLLAGEGVPRIQSSHLWGGVLVVVLIGQLAVMAPAVRAARLPPALTTRSG